MKKLYVIRKIILQFLNFICYIIDRVKQEIRFKKVKRIGLIIEANHVSPLNMGSFFYYRLYFFRIEHIAQSVKNFN